MRMAVLAALVLASLLARVPSSLASHGHRRPPKAAPVDTSQASSPLDSGRNGIQVPSLVDVTGVFAGTWTRLASNPSPGSSSSSSRQHDPATSSSATATSASQPTSSSGSPGSGTRPGGASMQLLRGHSFLAAGFWPALLTRGWTGRLQLKLSAGPFQKQGEEFAGVEGVLSLTDSSLSLGSVKHLTVSGFTRLDPQEPLQTLHALAKPQLPVFPPQPASTSHNSRNSHNSRSSRRREGSKKAAAAAAASHGAPQHWQQQQQERQQGQKQQEQQQAEPFAVRPLTWLFLSPQLFRRAQQQAAVQGSGSRAAAGKPAAGSAGGPADAAGSDSAECRFRLELAVASAAEDASAAATAAARAAARAAAAGASGHGTPASFKASAKAAVRTGAVVAAADQRRQQQQHRHHQQQQQQQQQQDGMVQRLFNTPGSGWLGFRVGWQPMLGPDAQLQQQQQQQHVDLQQEVVAAAVAGVDASHRGVRLLSMEDAGTAGAGAGAAATEPEAALGAAVDAAGLAGLSSLLHEPQEATVVSGIEEVASRAIRVLQTRNFPGFASQRGSVKAGGAAAAGGAVGAATAANQQGPAATAAAASSGSSLLVGDMAAVAAADVAGGFPPLLARWLLPCSHPQQRQLVRCQHVLANRELQQRLMIRGLLLSDNCNVSWALSAVELQASGLESHAVFYALLALGVCLLQVVLLRSQAAAVASSPAAALRVSLVGVCAGAQLDACLSMAHLVAALAAPDISMPLLVVAAAQFALFAGADMALLLHVWRAHNQHHQQQQRQQQRLHRSQAAAAAARSRAALAPGGLQPWHNPTLSPLGLSSLLMQVQQHWQQQLDRLRAGGGGPGGSRSFLESLVCGVAQLLTGRSLVLLYARLYLVLLAGIVLTWALASQLPLLLLVGYSFWLPQLLHNVSTSAKQPLQPGYILNCSFARLLLPLYTFTSPNNLLKLPPQPSLAWLLAGWVGIQVALLLLQHFTSPHVLLPAAWVPLRYDYHRHELPWQFKQQAAAAAAAAAAEGACCGAGSTGCSDSSSVMCGLAGQGLGCCLGGMSGPGCAAAASGGGRHLQLLQQPSSHCWACSSGASDSASPPGAAACGCGWQQRLPGCAICATCMQPGANSRCFTCTRATSSSSSSSAESAAWPCNGSSRQMRRHDCARQLVTSSFAASSDRTASIQLTAQLGTAQQCRHHQQQQALLLPEWGSSSRSRQPPPPAAQASAARTPSGSSSSSNSTLDRYRQALTDCCNVEDLLHDVEEDFNTATGQGIVECVICMAGVALLPVGERMVTPCGHFFHPDCLASWMEVKAECPTCRGALPPL